MLKQVVESIVLVTAQNLNTSSFSEKWFLQNSILKADEIQDGKTVTTPVYSLVHSNDFRIQVLSNQFVVFIEKIEEDLELQERVLSLLDKVISSNQLNPIAAVGINFHFVSEMFDNLEEMTRKLHFDSNNILHEFLKDEKNMRFGSYTSLDYLNSRLRIDIKPQTSMEQDKLGKEFLSAVFNYSKNIDADNMAEEIKAFMKNFVEFKNYAKKTVAVINEKLK